MRTILRPFALDTGRLDLLERYCALLRQWNVRMSLTAVRDEREVWIKHLYDSLAPLFELEQYFRPGVEMIDIGSGAGLPGMILAIARPDVHVSLLESTRKKADFLINASGELGLENVMILQCRAEDAARDPQLRERFDYALSRAVGELRVLIELSLPLLNIGGRLVAYKSADIGYELASCSRALDELRAEIVDIIPYSLPESMGERKLVVIEKRKESSDRFPRRAGIPRKRPL